MQAKRAATGRKGGLFGTFLRGASSAFILNLSARVLRLLMHVALARWLSVEGYGIYALVVAAVGMMAIFGKMGLDTLILRNVSAFAAAETWGRLKSFLTSANRLALGGSVAIVIAGEIGLWFFGDGIDPVLRGSWQVGFLLIPFMVLTGLRQEALRGLKRIVAARFPENVLVPILVLSILFFLGKFGTLSPQVALLVHLLAVGAAFGLGTWLLLRALPPVAEESTPSTGPRKIDLLKESFPFLLVASMQVILGKIDVLMLGYFLDVSLVGLYNVAVQLTTIAAFGLVAANTIAAPMISSYYTNEDHKALQETVSLTAVGATGFSLVVLIGFLLFGEFALSLFGEDYIASLPVLWILLVGRLASAFAGPVGWILAMTGRQKMLSRILIILALADIALNLALIPIWGVIGAAVATMGVNVLSNVTMGVYVYRNLRINPTCFHLPIYKTLIAKIRILSGR